MFTGPLQQLLTLRENERAAYRREEGGRLCQAEIPTAPPTPGFFENRQVLGANAHRSAAIRITPMLGILTSWLESLKSRLARPRRPRPV